MGAKPANGDSTWDDVGGKDEGEDEDEPRGAGVASALLAAAGPKGEKRRHRQITSLAIWLALCTEIEGELNSVTRVCQDATRPCSRAPDRPASPTFLTAYARK